MKGNEKLLTVLNQLLADELTAISQYMVHSEMCDSWGYDKLHKAIERQAMDEMHHAEWLIRRIIFLEGTPVISKLNPIKIGQTVSEMVGNDQEAELAAVRAYNQAIAMAREAGRPGDGGLAASDSQDGRGPRGLGRDAACPDRTDGSAELPGQSDRRRGQLAVGRLASRNLHRVFVPPEVSEQTTTSNVH